MFNRVEEKIERNLLISTSALAVKESSGESQPPLWML